MRAWSCAGSRAAGERIAGVVRRGGGVRRLRRARACWSGGDRGRPACGRWGSPCRGRTGEHHLHIGQEVEARCRAPVQRGGRSSDRLSGSVRRAAPAAAALPPRPVARAIPVCGDRIGCRWPPRRPRAARVPRPGARCAAIRQDGSQFRHLARLRGGTRFRCAGARAGCPRPGRCLWSRRCGLAGRGLLRPPLLPVHAQRRLVELRRVRDGDPVADQAEEPDQPAHGPRRHRRDGASRHPGVPSSSAAVGALDRKGPT